MKKLVLALVVIVIIAAVAFAVRTLGARDETSNVDKREAARIGKSSTDSNKAKSDDDTAAADIEPGLRPPAGTYTYTGSGEESVSALGGSKHVFPKTVYAVVTLDGKDECKWENHLIYVKEHVEERSYCTDAGGLHDYGFVRDIEFFNQTEHKVYTCPGETAIRMSPTAADGETTKWRCTNEPNSTSDYTATQVGTEVVKVGGINTKVWHMRVVADLKGDTRGRDVSEFWYAASGLTVRFTTNLNVMTKSVLGDTKFTEKTEYQLQSVTPTVEDD